MFAKHAKVSEKGLAWTVSAKRKKGMSLKKLKNTKRRRGKKPGKSLKAKKTALRKLVDAAKKTMNRHKNPNKLL